MTSETFLIFNRYNSMESSKILNKAIESLKKYISPSYFDYDYDSSSCDGDCDYICRCSRIINVKLKSIDRACFLHSLSKDSDSVALYCVDRVFNSCGFYDAENFSAAISGGYYGEELDGFDFDNPSEIINHLNKMMGVSDDEMIRYVLRVEYLFLLDRLETGTFSVEEVETSDVVSSNNNQMIKRVKGMDSYKDWALPICIVEKVGDAYRIIDGNHRFASNIDNEKIKVIVHNG